MATSLLKFAIHGNLARSIQEEINNRSSRYYFFLGRSQPWTDVGIQWSSGAYVASSDIVYIEVVGSSTIVYYSALNAGNLGVTAPTHTSGIALNGEVQLQYVEVKDLPQDVLDTYTYELQTRRDFISLKEISPNDTAIVIPRYDWTRGYIYDQYDEYSETYPAFSGATSLDLATFYVVTDEFNVYKCLYNNNNGASLTKPTGTDVAPIVHSDAQDGYIWKFMYNIPLTLRNKFLTGTQMPVTNALLGQFYSNGKIVKAIINNPGNGYEANVSLPGTFQSDIYIDPIENEPVYNLNTLICSEDMADYLQINKKIYIDGEVRTVTVIEDITRDEVTYHTIQIDEKIRIDAPVGAKKINTYLKVSGDGYREENPYVITGFSLVNSGSGYGAGTTVVISPPELSIENGGRQATAVPVLGGTGGDQVVGIDLIDPGYGYSISSPTVTITGGGGGGASFLTVTRKTEAYLEPTINPTYVDEVSGRVYGELRNVEILNGGVGYTNAVVTIERSYVTATINDELPPEEYISNASILLNFDTGDLNSKQANQELLATRGSIDVIQVLDGGAGYSSATVEISGTGSGCTATPVIANGKISKIIVTNPGINYTQATARIVSTTGSGANVRPIIAPLGGHGKDAVSELSGRTIVFYNKLAGEQLQGLDYTGMYRQVGIVKNPKQFNASNYFVNYFGNCCYRLELQLEESQDINQVIAKIDQSKTVNIISGANTYRYRPIERSSIGSTTIILLLSAIDYHIPSSGDTLIAGTFSLAVATVTTPTVDKYSGEVLYINNRTPFNYNEEQVVSVSSQFKL